jgi:hypothetical protein
MPHRSIDKCGTKKGEAGDGCHRAAELSSRGSATLVSAVIRHWSTLGNRPFGSKRIPSGSGKQWMSADGQLPDLRTGFAGARLMQGSRTLVPPSPVTKK